MPDHAQRVRALVRRTALLVTCASLAWALVLTAFGGFDVAIFGVRIRSNDPLRVLFMASLAFGTFILAGGSIRQTSVAVVARARAWVAILEQHQRWIACGLAIVTMLVAIAYSTRTAAGSDAYGYVSQAERWISGQVKEPLPWAAQAPWPQKEWTFSPLGYRPVERSGAWTSVPIYSPGLPLLMAAAKLVGGQCALFALVPLFGGVAVLATYGLGRRLGSSVTGLIAAWFVATSPVVLGMLMEPLTDVPVMGAWALAFFFLLGDGVLSAFAAGLLGALAILIRPNLFALAGIMAAWFFVRRGRDAHTFRSRLIHAGSFALGVLPGVVAVAAINQHLYGSPATSGYGRFEDQFAWSHVWPNLRRYVSWYIESQTPLALLGAAALAVPSQRLWPSVQDRSVFAIIGLFIATLWTEYCAYLEFDEWGYLRFLLPSWPFLMLGLAAVLLAVSRLDGRTMKPVAAVTIVGLGLCTFGIGVSRGAFRQWEVTRHDAALGGLVRAHTEPTAVVMTFERSGSLRYYAGRMTARYDLIDGDWLDRVVGWLTERGIHVYALLDDRDVAEWQRRFAGQRTLASFDSPVMVYRPVATSLFDLTRPLGTGAGPLLVTQVPPDPPGCDPPAAVPQLVLR